MRELFESLRYYTPQDVFAAFALALFWFGLFNLIEAFIP